MLMARDFPGVLLLEVSVKWSSLVDVSLMALSTVEMSCFHYHVENLASIREISESRTSLHLILEMLPHEQSLL